MIPPAYQGLEADEVALLSSADGGCLLRIIAGELAGHRGPGSTHTPMALMHATVLPGAVLELALEPRLQRPRLRARRIRQSRRRRPPGAARPARGLRARRLDARSAPTTVRTRALPDLEVLVLGGRPSASRSRTTGRSS